MIMVKKIEIIFYDSKGRLGSEQFVVESQVDIDAAVNHASMNCRNGEYFTYSVFYESDFEPYDEVAFHESVIKSLLFR